VALACKQIAEVAKDHQVIVTHGNGPQVGLLALQNEAYKKVTPYPLDILGAETQGMIGYMLMQSFKNHLPDKNIVTLLKQTLVDQHDVAFQNPTKFVGPVYSKEEAEQLALDKNWAVKQDGEHYRRVVPSPTPQSIIEFDIIQKLFQDASTLLICSGGGGVPVIQHENQLRGIEAVIDKDLAASLLARQLDVDLFIILTDVDAVETHFGFPDSQKIHRTTPHALSQMQFPSGSMGPKIQAAIEFVNQTSKTAVIGSLHQLADIIQSKAGTIIKA
jgi:carbamate kinase